MAAGVARGLTRPWRSGLLSHPRLGLDGVMTAVGRDGSRRVILRTHRTVLTTWLDRDASDLADLHADAETMRFVRNGRPESRSEVEALVRSYLSTQSERMFAKWRLTDLDDRLIGRAGFGGTDELRGISYLIARPLWGQGFATEVSRALVGWHRSHAPEAGLMALVAVANHASARVLEKVGFLEDGLVDYEGVPCRNFTYPISHL